MRDCGALAQLMPEVNALYTAGSRARRSKASPGSRLSLALEYAAKRGFTLAGPVCRARTGFRRTRRRASRSRGRAGQTMRDVRLAEAMSARLRVPVECRDAARLAARWHRIVARAPALQPAALLDVINAADAPAPPGAPRDAAARLRMRRDVRAGCPGRFRARRATWQRRSQWRKASPPARSPARPRRRPGLPASERADTIAKAIRSARLTALRAWKRTGR